MINNTNLKLVSSALLAAVFASGCSVAKFQMNTKAAASAGAAGNIVSSVPGTCDPNAASNIVAAKLGLKTTVYTPPAGIQYNVSSSYAEKGTAVASVISPDLNVATRYYTAGFPNGVDMFRDGSGSPLTTYFGIKFETNLKLAAGDQAGRYELAMLADDGVTILQVNTDGTTSKLLEDENDHGTRLACMHSELNMTSSTRVPLRITYYQGPQVEIAAVLLWRRVDNLANPHAGLDPDCGGAQNTQNYFDAYSSPMSQQLQGYKDLLARGWTPVPNANLEITAASNLCSSI